jgi:hypothetical protein
MTCGLHFFSDWASLQRQQRTRRAAGLTSRGWQSLLKGTQQPASVPAGSALHGRRADVKDRPCRTLIKVSKRDGFLVCEHHGISQYSMPLVLATAVAAAVAAATAGDLPKRTCARRVLPMHHEPVPPARPTAPPIETTVPTYVIKLIMISSVCMQDNARTRTRLNITTTAHRAHLAMRCCACLA